MDEAVNLVRAALAALVLLAVQAQAQELQDPTRPPAQFGPHAAGASTPSGAPQLQSVLVARESGGRKVAVIDGETVRPGESFRGARVARITQNEVELVRGSERQVLKLFTPAPLAAAAVTTAAATAAISTATP